jgi:hypothetical protein
LRVLAIEKSTQQKTRIVSVVFKVELQLIDTGPCDVVLKILPSLLFFLHKVEPVGPISLDKGGKSGNDNLLARHLVGRPLNSPGGADK